MLQGTLKGALRIWAYSCMIIKRDPDIIKGYFEDTSNIKGGFAEAVVIPETVGELSDFVREANINKTPMTVSGGGTGTTGARVPFGGVVISLEKFDKIEMVSEEGMLCRLEAAVSVEDLKAACEEKGLFYTSHPTERSATVGGTVATNASGARSFKYGPTRFYVRKLNMVMPTGHIFSVERGEYKLARNFFRIKLSNDYEVDVPLPSYRMPKVKNAAGYFTEPGMDLVDLFIGQEGTLAIITGAELALVKKPEKILSAFAFFPSEEDAWSFAAAARKRSRETHAGLKTAMDALSIEYLSSSALKLLERKNPNIPSRARAAIFFEQETTGVSELTMAELWLALVAKHNGSADDTWVAMTSEEGERFNDFRHSIPESVNEMVKRNGFQKLSADIAVPDSAFIDMMRFYNDVLAKSGLANVIFGHIGECHAHVNILPRTESELLRARSLILDFVKKGVSLGGTISAEHGVGKIKHKYLEIMYGREGILEMARVKKALDPNCLLGLDNLFSRDILRSI